MMKQQIIMTQKGFTLVELLIVVIILAILAAIVVPQYASTTDDAKISALDSTLANMRSSIDLYYQQHGKYPGSATAISTYTCTTPGTGDAAAGNEEQTMMDQMSLYTATNGMACTIKDGTNHKYGPYLKKNILPANPVTGVSTLVISLTGDLAMTTGTAGGWKYDTVSGKFIANDDTNDPSGVPYNKH